MVGRFVGLDVGDVRIGVAVSDPLGIIAQPHSVIKNVSREKSIQAIVDLVKEREAVRVVVGLPLNIEGQVGPQAGKVLAFVESLRAALDVEIVTQDERYSSSAAQSMLIAANVSRKNRKGIIDKVAAHHILQTYLDRMKNTQDREQRHD